MERSILSPVVAQLHDRSSSGDAEVLRLLLIEDCQVDACLIKSFLASTDDVTIELEHAGRLSAGLSCLKDEQFHAVLVDLNLPDSEGVDTVIQTHACAPRIPIVVLTDGVLEARSPEGVAFGVERTLEVVRANGNRPAAEVVDAIHKAVEEFCRPLSPVDDVTMIVIKVDTEENEADAPSKQNRHKT